MTQAEIFRAYFAHVPVAKYDDCVNYNGFFAFYNTSTDQEGTPIFGEKTFTTPSKITILSCEELSDVTDIIDSDADVIAMGNDRDPETTEKIYNLITNVHSEFELAISDSPQATWKLYSFTSEIHCGIIMHSLHFIENKPEILSEYLACHNDDMYQAWLERHTVEVSLERDITLLVEFGDNIAYIYEQRCSYIDRETAAPSPYALSNDTVRITEIINGQKTRRFYGWAIPEEIRDDAYGGVLNAWEITTYKPAD